MGFVPPSTLCSSSGALGGETENRGINIHPPLNGCCVSDKNLLSIAKLFQSHSGVVLFSSCPEERDPIVLGSKGAVQGIKDLPLSFPSTTFNHAEWFSLVNNKRATPE